MHERRLRSRVGLGSSLAIVVLLAITASTPVFAEEHKNDEEHKTEFLCAYSHVDGEVVRAPREQCPECGMYYVELSCGSPDYWIPGYLWPGGLFICETADLYYTTQARCDWCTWTGEWPEHLHQTNHGAIMCPQYPSKMWCIY